MWHDSTNTFIIIFTLGNHEKEAGNTKTKADVAEQTDSTTKGMNIKSCLQKQFTNKRSSVFVRRKFSYIIFIYFHMYLYTQYLFVTSTGVSWQSM